MNLSKPTLPEAALDGITTIFLESSDDFAIAIDKEYVWSKLDPALEPLRKFSPTVPTRFCGTYSVSIFPEVKVEWRPGDILLTINGQAKGGHLGSTYDFTVRQALALTLDPSTQTVAIEFKGEPSIVGLPGPAKAEARARIFKEGDKALVSVQKTITAALSDVSLNGVLKPFDGAARSRYTSVDFQPTGVILRGKIDLKARPPVHVEFSPTPGGYTALETWIPGGTVHQYLWSWTMPVRPEKATKVFPEVEFYSKVVRDRFMFAEHLPTEASPVCLRVQGTQVSSTEDGTTPVDAASRTSAGPVLPATRSCSRR